MQSFGGGFGGVASLGGIGDTNSEPAMDRTRLFALLENGDKVPYLDAWDPWIVLTGVIYEPTWSSGQFIPINAWGYITRTALDLLEAHNSYLLYDAGFDPKKSIQQAEDIIVFFKTHKLYWSADVVAVYHFNMSDQDWEEWVKFE